MKVIEKNVVEIVKLANKTAKRDIDVDSLQSLPLFSFNDANRFQQFVVHERLRPFLMMKIIFHLGRKAKWMIGNGDTAYVQEYSPGATPRECGPTILPSLYGGTEVFQHLVASLGFLHIDTSDSPAVKYQERISSKGEKVKAPLGWHESLLQEVLVCLDLPLVISETRVYYPSTPGLITDIMTLLSFHKNAFDKFLNEYKEKCIPHEIYVKWLLSWFPGMVRVRSLEPEI
ncbi:hypothetical protein GF342_00905 [Candidatus Woesearchaeota archaeon]|nr:hypothetical protein [Candidatus Woesearchaeota archaeon]